jgi:hypothetical protein
MWFPPRPGTLFAAWSRRRSRVLLVFGLLVIPAVAGTLTDPNATGASGSRRPGSFTVLPTQGVGRGGEQDPGWFPLLGHPGLPAVAEGNGVRGRMATREAKEPYPLFRKCPFCGIHPPGHARFGASGSWKRPENGHRNRPGKADCPFQAPTHESPNPLRRLEQGAVERAWQGPQKAKNGPKNCP